MSDEKINEEYDKFEKAFDWEQEYDNYKAIFISGFRAAERLAKIEVLENLAQNYNGGIAEWVMRAINKELESLKAGQ